jgi:hypothetical protein
MLCYLLPSIGSQEYYKFINCETTVNTSGQTGPHVSCTSLGGFCSRRAHENFSHGSRFGSWAGKRSIRQRSLPMTGMGTPTWNISRYSAPEEPPFYFGDFPSSIGLLKGIPYTRLEKCRNHVDSSYPSGILLLCIFNYFQHSPKNTEIEGPEANLTQPRGPPKKTRRAPTTCF